MEGVQKLHVYECMYILTHIRTCVWTCYTSYIMPNIQFSYLLTTLTITWFATLLFTVLPSRGQRDAFILIISITVNGGRAKLARVWMYVNMWVRTYSYKTCMHTRYSCYIMTNIQFSSTSVNPRCRTRTAAVAWIADVLIRWCCHHTAKAYIISIRLT